MQVLHVLAAKLSLLLVVEVHVYSDTVVLLLQWHQALYLAPLG